MSRSRTYATPAIVLRRTDFGEADRLVTLLTPNRGKLRVIAKGARKMTSRKAGHIELFAHTQVLLAHARTFDLITQAELLEPHLPLREDVMRGGLAHYLCELADQFAQEEHEDTALFDLMAEGLGLLSTARDPALAVRYCEMRLLDLSGYKPQLYRCALTGAAIEADSETADAVTHGTPFSSADGGVLSRAALAQAREWVTLSHSGLMLLRALQTQPFAALEALAVTREVHAELERAMQSYVSFVTERRMRSMAYVKQLQRNG
jgi:DNA repair protein RecO (recombination protein O)